jgi:hypothetical protein
MANYHFNFSPQLNNYETFWRIISFPPLLVFLTPKAHAVRGVFAAPHSGVRAYTRFNQAAKPENSPFRTPIQSNSLKLRRETTPTAHFFCNNPTYYATSDFNTCQ